MAAKVSNAQINTLVSLYLKLYKEKYSFDPPGFNRFRDKWGFRDMIEDLGMARSKEVITYYFDTRHIGHPVQQLFYNYDRLSDLMKEREEDEKNRERLRAETEARVKAWRERYAR